MTNYSYINSWTHNELQYTQQFKQTWTSIFSKLAIDKKLLTSVEKQPLEMEEALWMLAVS